MRRLFPLLLVPAALFGQGSWNSVTVTASRNTDTQPDQAVFSVGVTAGADKGLNDILAALDGTGIAATDLSGVSAAGQTSPLPPATQPVPLLEWRFQLNTPVAKVRDTIAQLSRLQQNIPQNKSGLSLSFTMQGLTASPQSQQQTCSLPGLVSDARAQAQKLAGAAGLSPGAIIGLASATASPYAAPCSLTARFAVGAMFARTEPDSITITASRLLNPQPDQVLLAVSVNSSGGATLDDVVALLQGTGITASDLINADSYSFVVGPGPETQTSQRWMFSLAAPLARMKETIAALLAAQQAAMKKGSGFGLTFSAAGLQVSPELRKAQVCPQADLIADARSQAQKVAASAGVSVGSVLGVSDGTAGALGTIGLPVFASRAGFFYGQVSSVLTSVPYTCSATVQFQLLR